MARKVSVYFGDREGLPMSSVVFELPFMVS